MQSFSIHMRAISQDIYFDESLKITNLRLQQNLPETNELTLTTLKWQWLNLYYQQSDLKNNLEYILIH